MGLYGSMTRVAGTHPCSGFNNKLKQKVIRSLLRYLRLCYCGEAFKHYNMLALTLAEHMAAS